MSWLFSQALVAEYLEDNSLDGEQCAPLNVMPTPRPFWRNDKTMDVLNRSPFGLTWKPLTESRGKELLTWFRAGFPARTLVQQAKEQESKANDQAYGQSLHASLAKYDPDSCSWKTHQYSLLGDLIEFSGTWPRWGLMRDGGILPQEMKVPLLQGADYLLPAPTKSIGKRGWGFSKTGKPRYSKQRQENALLFGYKPHPNVLEWSMGWPITWTLLEPLATDKFQQWLQQHGDY
jgi:hypothetical protein